LETSEIDRRTAYREQLQNTACLFLQDAPSAPDLHVWHWLKRQKAWIISATHEPGHAMCVFVLLDEKQRLYRKTAFNHRFQPGKEWLNPYALCSDVLRQIAYDLQVRMGLNPG
jgi:hypothetical protein